VDFGVVALPVTDARLVVVPIHRDEIVLIVARKHHLSTFKSVQVEEIANYPLLLPKSGRTRESIDELFGARNLSMDISMELDSSEVLKRFVAAGVGIGFTAKSNVTEDVRAGVLASIPIAGAPLRRELGLIYRKDKAMSRGAQAFIEIAMKNLHF
jgi:DNA-binding transcriptional LysR family regulator